MFKRSLVFSLLFIFLILGVSAQPFQQGVQTSGDGAVCEISYPQYNFVKRNTAFNISIHVYDTFQGDLINATTLSCYLHLSDPVGTHVLDSVLFTVEDDDIEVGINSSIFDELGLYGYEINCNGTVTDKTTNPDVDYEGGCFVRGIFQANDYGLELNEGSAGTFNWSMLWLMGLFILCLIGLFSFDNYIAKFSFYWVAHVLFIVGTFSVWQFASGYGIGYTGLASIFKVLFYVSITAVFPMLILSIAWIFYIHTFNEHFQKILDKGEDPETAFALTKRERGGWFHGRSR